MVPGRFSWFFMAPGRLSMVTGGFFLWVFMVFHGSRLVFHGSR